MRGRLLWSYGRRVAPAPGGRPDGSRGWAASFPAERLSPGKYTISIRAAGYTLAEPKAADVTVEIPMHARTANSLNASAAAAVLLFEADRQRRG